MTELQSINKIIQKQNETYLKMIRPILKQQIIVNDTFKKINNLYFSSAMQAFNKLNIESIYPLLNKTSLTSSIPSTNLKRIINDTAFTIPSDSAIRQLNINIEHISSILDNIDFSNISSTIEKQYINNTWNLDFDFPKNISISEMVSTFDDDAKNEDFDENEFKRELALINFTNDLDNVVLHFTNAFIIADHCIDNSIKEKIYQVMIDGIIELFAKGMALIGVFILFVILTHYLRDCTIYKHFIDLCKEAKETFKD